MSHRIRLALAAALALAALAGAGLPAAAQTPKPGGTLRAAMRAEVSTYDPHKGASGSDHMYLYPVFDTLVRFDEKMTARPGARGVVGDAGPEDPGAQAQKGRQVPRRHAVQCRGRPVQPRPRSGQGRPPR